MTDVIVVAGGTGLTGANVCEQLIERGDAVRALVRHPADAAALTAIGTTNVLDAAKSHGMRRVVALSTATFIDLTTAAPFEDAPVLDDPPDDPYAVTKLAAFREAHVRADAGEDVLTCHPGAIYGPDLVARRALHRTSFNRVLLAGMRGRLTRYLSFPVTWVAAGCNRACEIAGIDHRVEDLDYRSDPEALTRRLAPR
ncbi:MAG: hypothetical protein QOF25_2354 [Mycobacterium sp.]|nr:hypothetical protein [Mycobacterium sp.]